MRALIAEDNPGIGAYMVEEAEEAGAEVTFADNGIGALQAIASSERPFDVLFTDYLMPGADGIEVVRKAVECGVGHIEVFSSKSGPVVTGLLEEAGVKGVMVHGKDFSVIQKRIAAVMGRGN
jgi:CheY-like chemotaxis protein